MGEEGVELRGTLIGGVAGMMTEYYIPTAPSETEFTEKRSRFIGHVWRVESETEARAHVEEMKKRYYDARHNCWCYRLREGGVERYSDDGEPQGTAGQPMLNVFQREQVENVCCVVTRYFGGILLGAGGLVRAYTQSAKDALDAAGISVVRRWVEAAVPCPTQADAWPADQQAQNVKLHRSQVYRLAGLPHQPALRIDLQRAIEQWCICGGGHRGEICDRSKGRHGVCKDGVLAVTE